MLIATLAAVALTLTQSDTGSVTVQRGDRFSLAARAGDVTVRTWGRNTVQVRSDGDRNVAVVRRGNMVTIEANHRHGGRPGDDEAGYDVTVPSWMDLSLSGVSGDVRITGTTGAISVETVDGDVTVRGGRGVIALSSVSGDVELDDAEGKISLSSVNADVSGSRLRGQVSATTVNGTISLDGVESDDVDANTVNGDVTYDGPIRNGGRYRLVSHNGDLTLSIQENASATVSVSTFQGDFEAVMPIMVEGGRRSPDRKRFTFTVGSGSARIELESFQGTIRVQRPQGRSDNTRTRR